MVCDISRLVVVLAVLVVVYLLIPNVVSNDCPDMCKCSGNEASCTRRNRSVKFVPPLPKYVTVLIFRQKNLQHVSRATFENISGNNITRLQLSNNMIKSITSDAFSDFTYLESLCISDNPSLTPFSVAATFANISSSLTHLYLQGMGWTDIPKDFFNDLTNKNIRKLVLKKNKLRDIKPSTFSPFPQLESLNLDRNNIKSIEFGVMDNLKELTVKRNKLTSVPNFCFTNGSLAKSLSHLDLSKNILDENYSPQCLDSLKTLYLNANPISVLKDNFIAGLPSIENVTLMYLSGRFWKIEKYAFNSSSMKYLKFSSNDFKFSTITQSFDEVNIFKHCLSLEYLKLSKNVLTLRSDSLRNMFLPLKNLRELQLYDTGLVELPNGLFNRLPKLTTLGLSGNKIQGWDSNVFRNLISLQHLKLNKNLISVVHQKLFPLELLKSLKTLNLGDNPFSCTCDQMWFTNWIQNEIQTVSIRLQGWPESYTCASPKPMKGKPLSIYKPSVEMCSVTIVVSVSVSALVASLTIFSALVYKGRWHIRYWIYLLRSKRRKINTLLQDHVFTYDAFVIYCDEDREWVHSVLLTTLENEENLKLCIHFRDFDVGKLIVDNIDECIHQSRKIIVVISNNFTKSDWCLFELRLAHSRYLHGDSDIFILIMLEDLHSKNLTGSLSSLLTSVTYAVWSETTAGSKMFWNQIIASLKLHM